MKLRKSKKSASNLKNIVREIIDETSKDASVDIYNDSRIFMNLLEDRLYKYPNDVSRLKLAVEQGLHQKIRYEITAKNISRVNVFTDMLISIYSVTPEAALSTIDVLCYAIHGFSVENRSEAVGESKWERLALSFSLSLSAILFFAGVYFIGKPEGIISLCTLIAAAIFFITKDVLFLRKNKNSKTFKNDLFGIRKRGPVRVYRHIMHLLIWLIALSYCVLFRGIL